MICTIPRKRWTDQGEPGERVTYDALNATGNPRAIIEPESVGLGSLVEADAATILAGATFGIAGTITKSGAETVNGNTVLEFSDQIFVTNANTSMVVVFPQPDTRVVFSGFIVLEPTSDGSAPVPRLVWRGHNLTATNKAIADLSVLNFVCLLKTPMPLPASPNAELVVTPGKVWTPGEPLLPAGLNLMATPTAAYPANGIGKIELNTPDTLLLASRYAGKRGSLVTSLTSVAAGTTVSLGTATISGATAGKPVIVSPAGFSGVMFTGYVSGADTVTVHARAISLLTASVPAGLVLRIIVLQ